MTKVEKVFEYELNLIKYPPLRDFVIRCYNKYCPESYWTVPTSTTGKYHPSFVNKEGGLVVHVKYTVWWALELLQAYPEGMGSQDEVVSALLLHDLFKNGIGKIKDRPSNITFTHGVHLAAIIAENGGLDAMEQRDLSFNDRKALLQSQERILAAIGGHMGVWTKPIMFSCWNQKDEKSRHVAMIVHLSDYCAAKKVAEFIVPHQPDTVESVEVNDFVPMRQETSYSNGRSLNKTFEVTSDPYMFATILFELVDERQPNYYKRYKQDKDGKEYFIQKEAAHFDLLIRKDGFTSDEILRILEWSQADSFWQKNIKSGLKFREKFDKLLECAGPAIKDIKDENPELTEQIVQQYVYFVNNDDFAPTNAQWAKFVETSKKLVKFFSSDRYKDIEPEQRIILLSGCIQKNFSTTGRILYPGSLCSDEVWEILLPQYLSELG
jgi:hypothetical protein